MLTLPNILTLSRIVAVPLARRLLWPAGGWFEYALTFALYCLIGITDYFDGYVARARGAVSKLGIFLDPIADKIMVAAVIVMLVFDPGAHSGPVIHGLHIVPALIILIREIAVSGLREFLAGLQVSVPVSQLAKWKTTPSSSSHWAPSSSAARCRNGRGSTSSASPASGPLPRLTMITGWDYLRTGLRHMD
jgi:cardiolipin synthase